MVVEEVGEEAGIVDVVGGEAEAVVVIVDVEVMMLAYSCSGVKVHTMSLLSHSQEMLALLYPFLHVLWMFSGSFSLPPWSTS